jgi:ribonuclease VapC
MVLDTSALVAILLAEPEATPMLRALALDALLERLGARVIEVSLPAAKLARMAYARSGRGVGDPGVLNFGDCLSYGVSMAERQPLLFKGGDCSQTDVEAAVY